MAPDNTRERVLEIARAEVGTVGGQKYVRFYNELTGLGLPLDANYCACEVTYIKCKAGVPANSIPNFKGCSTGTDWFKAQGRYRTRASGYTPRPGDVIFFEWDPGDKGTPRDDGTDHTGIVESVEDGVVHTIEGNTDGGYCRRKSWDINSRFIDGYGVPLYNTRTEEEEMELTYEIFKKFMDRYETEQAKKAASKWAIEALKYGKEYGIMVGDAAGNQMPQVSADREDVMQMLYKVLCQFHTVDDLAGWAKRVVQPLVKKGVIAGTGEIVTKEVNGETVEIPVLDMSLIEVRVYCIVVRLLQALGVLPEDLEDWK